MKNIKKKVLTEEEIQNTIEDIKENFCELADLS
jgi:hypothetical protein